MKFYKTIQKNFAIVGISLNQSQAFTERIVIMFFLYGLGFTSCAIFLFHEANTFLEYANNMFITTGMAMIIIVFMIVVFKMAKSFELISAWEQVVDQKSTLRSMAIYEETAQLVEKWCKIGYFVMAKVTPVSWIFPKAIFNYFIYFSTNVGNEAFELPLPSWFPFNWKNPIGYLVAITLQYIVITAVFLFGAGVIFHGVGSFLFAVSGTKDVKINLESIKKHGISADNLSWALSQLSDFIQFHGQLKQLAHDFLEIYQPKFMVLCTWSLGTICGVMLMIQIQIHEFISLAVLLLTIFYTCYAFGVVFIICELGQRTTDAFEEINVEIDRFDWYLFPPEIQRMLPTIMIATQQEVVLECFGSITGSRETFKNVVKTGISYFMVMRQFM